MTGKKKDTAQASDWIDPDDAPELTDEWFARAKLVVGGKEVARRGRPPLDSPKEPATLRFDADLLRAMKATGRGWQTRVNDQLREVYGLGASAAGAASAIRAAKKLR
jgi:uncharacterized protein (DUF4415 family)